MCLFFYGIIIIGDGMKRLDITDQEVLNSIEEKIDLKKVKMSYIE